MYHSKASRLVRHVRPGNAQGPIRAPSSLVPRRHCNLVCAESPLANDDAPGSFAASTRPNAAFTHPAECPSARFPIWGLATTILVTRSALCARTGAIGNAHSRPLPLNVQRFHVIPGISFSQTAVAQFCQRLPLAASHAPVRNAFWLNAPLVMLPSDLSTCICTSSPCAPIHGGMQWASLGLWSCCISVLRNGNPRSHLSIGAQASPRCRSRPVAV